MKSDSNATFSADGSRVTVRPTTVTLRPSEAVATFRPGSVPAPGEEHHFTLTIGKSVTLAFIRRPISTPAREGQIAFLDGVDESGRIKREVAVFKGGEWKGGKGGAALRIVPVMWTTCGEMEAAANVG